MLLQVIIVINQVIFFYLLTVPLDTSLDLSQEGIEVRNQLKLLYLGINSYLTFLVFMIMSVRSFTTMLLLFIYAFISTYFADSVGMYSVVSKFYKIFSVISFFGWIIIVYLQEKSSKEIF